MKSADGAPQHGPIPFPASLRGIITVLNAPFSADDSLDLDGLKANIADALEAGVAGFLIPAKASEVLRLTAAERESLVTAALEAVDGAVPVIGGAEAATCEERIAWVKRLAELGCGGVLVCIPYDTEHAFESELRWAAECAPAFMMVQDWDPAGFGLPVPLIQRLHDDVKAFKCLKVEVAAAGLKYSRVLDATAGKLHVSGGWAVTQMIEALDRGVHAFMPTGMHRIYVQIYRRYHAGLRDEAQALFERILPVLAFSNQHLDISIQFFKRLLHAQRIYSTPRVREPLLTFDAHHERIARRLIDHVIRLDRELRRG